MDDQIEAEELGFGFSPLSLGQRRSGPISSKFLISHSQLISISHFRAPLSFHLSPLGLKASPLLSASSQAISNQIRSTWPSSVLIPSLQPRFDLPILLRALTDPESLTLVFVDLESDTVPHARRGRFQVSNPQFDLPRASESTFSAGGRVIDPYRTALDPTTVQALICGDWLRKAHGIKKKKKSEDEIKEREIMLPDP